MGLMLAFYCPKDNFESKNKSEGGVLGCSYCKQIFTVYGIDFDLSGSARCNVCGKKSVYYSYSEISDAMNKQQKLICFICGNKSLGVKGHYFTIHKSLGVKVHNFKI